MEDKRTELNTSSPLKAIKSFCYQCCGYSSQEVKKCTASNCPLYKYRFGRGKTKSKKEYTDEEREAMKQRMERARASKM